MISKSLILKNLITIIFVFISCFYSNFIVYLLSYILTLITFFGWLEIANSLLYDFFVSLNKSTYSKLKISLILPIFFTVILIYLVIFERENIKSEFIFYITAVYIICVYYYFLKLFAKHLNIINSFENRIYYKIIVCFLCIANTLIAIGIYDYTKYSSDEVIEHSKKMFAQGYFIGYMDCFGQGLKILKFDYIHNEESLFAVLWWGGVFVTNKLLLNERKLQ